MKRRIHVDYNTIEIDDPRQKVYIDTYSEPELLEILCNGLSVVLYDHESLEVNAVAEYDEETKQWYGIPDWPTSRDLPRIQ